MVAGFGFGLFAAWVVGWVLVLGGCGWVGGWFGLGDGFGCALGWCGSLALAAGCLAGWVVGFGWWVARG